MDGALTTALMPCVESLQADGGHVRCALRRDHDGPHRGGTTDTDLSWRRRWEV